MRIEQFEYLMEISKNKSMNAASQKLHITPQALSSAIKKLEEELGLTILERTTMGVSLTNDGKALLLLAENFLSGLKELQGETSDCGMPIYGPMRLSIPRGFTETYLPELLRTIYADFPEMEIISTPCCYADIIERVEKHIDDYGLTYRLYINGVDIIKDIPDHFTFTTLYKAKFYCSVPNNFPCAKYKSISLKTMLEYPIIMYEPANYLMNRIVEYAGTPSRIINVPSVEVIKQLSNEGIGLAFGMYNLTKEAFSADYGENVRYINFKEHVIAEFGYIVKKDRKLSESALMQIEYLTDFFKK